jgi:hypothetical protein
MSTNTIRYDRYMQDAMRTVVARVLKDTAQNGLPGKHYFLVSFRTHHAGVEIGEDLRSRYPQSMTIVLQHQFWDLQADDRGFSVTLSFSKVPQRLRIPYAAITGFVDPEAKVDMHFVPDEGVEPAPERTGLPAQAAAAQAAPPPRPSGDGKVVPLDTFRRK